MNSALIDGVCLVSASYSSDIPYTEWEASNSYLICRALLQRGIFHGKVVLGTRLVRHKEALSEGDHGVFSVLHTQYGWVILTDGSLLDPVGCLQNIGVSNKPQFRIESDVDCYIDGIDPISCHRGDLPKHYLEDEIYPVKRGVMRELCARILGYELQVEGLTMAEAVYIINQPLNAFNGHSRMLYEHFMSQGLSRIMPISKVKVVNPALAKKLWQSFFVDTDEADMYSTLR